MKLEPRFYSKLLKVITIVPILVCTQASWYAHQLEKTKQTRNMNHHFNTTCIHYPFSYIKLYTIHDAPYLIISPLICVPLAISTFAPPQFLWPQTGAAPTLQPPSQNINSWTVASNLNKFKTKLNQIQLNPTLNIN